MPSFFNLDLNPSSFPARVCLTFARELQTQWPGERAGKQDDRLFEVMAGLTPSVYQVLADIVKEELRELPGRLKSRQIQAGCLTSALLATNLRAIEGEGHAQSPAQHDSKLPEISLSYTVEYQVPATYH
jgi:hypothetical protein